MQRRERTRHLIELGGLVQKAGLVELTDDDRATLYGALLDLAGGLHHGFGEAKQFAMFLSDTVQAVHAASPLSPFRFIEGGAGLGADA